MVLRTLVIARLTVKEAARRRLLLARHRVTYVLAGPWERALGAYDPTRAPYLRMVLHTGRWRLFRLTLPAAPGGAA